MTKPKYEDFVWLDTKGDLASGLMCLYFGNYCTDKRQELRLIAFDFRRRGFNAETLT